MIFSELYGTYYNTMARIISKALEGNLTQDGIFNCIMENAYSESVIPITDAVQEKKWQLVNFDREKNHFSSILKNNPEMPLTNLQLQYLKAILNDKRIRLFDLDFEYYDRLLKDVEPLWMPGDYQVFDSYDDGDDFDDLHYKKRFRMILEAKAKHLTLEFSLKNRHGKEFRVTGIPDKIEYSEKDDKFRVILAGRSETHTINMGRIVSLCFASDAQKKCCMNSSGFDIDTIVLELTDDRNALERVCMHFANLKKRITKLGGNKYRMELEFSRDDETEMIIRLLQFGPVIKVLEPAYIVGTIVKRLGMQLRLMRQSL